MAYLEEFQKQLENHDYQGFMHLWEEYCSGDEVDAIELRQILKAVKSSDFAATFGKHIDSALSLCARITDENERYEVFKLIIDLQTTNTAELAAVTHDLLQQRFGHLPHFNEKIRLVGLKGKSNFQGAVSNFELLSHVGKGKFVFHTGGWGTGEVVDLSLLREELVLEFDRVTGKRSLSFSNAFKCLIPLADDHFLARRFGFPDELETEAKKDPAGVIRLLLKDLGPKTASEIKEELCDWVIPEDEWTKWWGTTRTKIKKDTLIEVPGSIKDPFSLRTARVSHEDRFLKTIAKEIDTNHAIEAIYSFIRDYPEVVKNAETKTSIRKHVETLLAGEHLIPAQKVQLLLILEDLGSAIEKADVITFIKALPNVQNIVNEVHVGAFKKRILVVTREERADWVAVFLDLLFSSPAHSLRDYLVKELNQGPSAPLLLEKLHFLAEHPSKHPELFVWYFQKVAHEEGIPFANKEGRCKFLESLMMLLSQIEEITKYRDLVKKIHAILSEKRFATVRAIIENTSIEFIKEFILLVTKCRSLTDHDSKILHSLSHVVHPSLNKKKGSDEDALEIIWTTQEGFQRMQARIQHIGTVETVENAKEIEVARAHGDLRENSEYKFALEKRSRLQGELKFLTHQANLARVITAQDISTDEVGIGSVVDLVNSKGITSRYTLLGPWDADTEKNILSLQSKFAQAMTGVHLGDSFKFLDEEYTVKGIESYLN